MTSEAKFEDYKFTKISVDNFIKRYRMNNLREDLNKLRKDILYFRQLKIDGVKCACRNPIVGSWIRSFRKRLFYLYNRRD